MDSKLLQIWNMYVYAYTIHRTYSREEARSWLLYLRSNLLYNSLLYLITHTIVVVVHMSDIWRSGRGNECFIKGPKIPPTYREASYTQQPDWEL